LKDIIALRLNERNTFIENLRKQLNQVGENTLYRRRWITSLNFGKLVDELQKGTVSAKEALEAYQWKAIEANDVTNSVCLFFPQAIEWAEDLDRKYGGGDVEKPPLFGVPLSIKETIRVKGFDSTRGYANSLFDASSEDAAVVASLRRLGAVPFVHTNIPQGLFWFGCSNPIYGTTKNPHDPNRTSGGSSGGEAALLGAGGSIVGIGGDVGGSIRIPSHFCGVVGLKPASSRLSQIGSLASVPGRPFLNASIGPMGRDVDSVAAIMRCLTSDEKMYKTDPYMKPYPWREEIYNGEDSKSLTIGYYVFDNFFEATPACRRAVDEAKSILIKKGHKLVPYQPPNTEDLARLFIGAALNDGGEYLRRMALSDVLDPFYAPVVKIYGIPAILKRFLGYLLSPFSPIASLMILAAPRSLVEMRSIYEEIENARIRYVESWKAHSVDAVICPAFGCTALPHDAPVHVPVTAIYVSVFNLLDFTAGVLPVTKVSENDELLMTDGYQKKEMLSRRVAQYCKKGTVGLPVGVQCVTMPNEEERCLRVMKDIENGLKNI